jgi:hypothetical protein
MITLHYWPFLVPTIFATGMVFIPLGVFLLLAADSGEYKILYLINLQKIYIQLPDFSQRMEYWVRDDLPQ